MHRLLLLFNLLNVSNSDLNKLYNNNHTTHNNYIQHVYLKSLIIGEIKDNSMLQKDLNNLNIKLNTQEPVYTIVGHIDEIPDGFHLEDTELVFYVLQNIIREHFQTETTIYGTLCYENYFVFLIQTLNEAQKSTLLNSIKVILTKIQKEYNKITGKSISLIFPENSSDFTCIPNYYNEAINRFIFKQFSQSKQEESNSSLIFLKDNYVPLEVAIESNNYESFANILNKLSFQEQSTLKSIEIISIITTILFKATVKNNDESLMNELQSLLNYPYTTFKEGIERLLQCAKMICESSKSNQIEKDWKLLKKIDEYIDLHIDEDLCLNTIAQEMYHSPSYFSKLFKRHAGTGFCSYIKKKKMEKACYLLKNTDMKPAEIATKIGYDSQTYFIKLFKNNYGTTPIDYREVWMNK